MSDLTCQHRLLWNGSRVALTTKRRFNSLSANFTKWSNTLKQFVGKLPTNCLSMFDHFVELSLKGLRSLVGPLYKVPCMRKEKGPLVANVPSSKQKCLNLSNLFLL